MNNIIPRPMRDLLWGIGEVKNAISGVRGQKDGSAGAAIVGTLGGGTFILPLAQKLIKAGIRVTLVAVATFTLSQVAGSLPVAATLGALVSLPTTAIITGSWLLYYGVMMTTSALSTGAFATLGTALASLAGGYITLEFHDLFSFGIAELCLIAPYAIRFAPNVIRALT